MSKKKRAQEELMKTHVLNLEEIRDAEAKDKYNRRKKIPKLFIFIGFILIVVGMTVSSLVTYIKNEKNKNSSNNTKNKNQLICISNLLNNYFLTDIHTVTTYQFKDGLLYISNTESTIVPTDKINYLVELQNYFHTNSYETDKYILPKGGIDYSLDFSNKNKMIITFNINYDDYTDNNKQDIINKFVNVPKFSNKTDLKTVIKDSEKLGALCNKK